jgi:putative PIN family toxin of toxin-antitoxin system
MRILVDTNILISALLYPDSNPAKALMYVTEHHELVLTDYNIFELRSVTKRKFPHKEADIDVLLNKLTFELVPAPLSPQKLMADPKDAPILNAALVSGVDIIISGDKHFLNLDMEYLEIMTAADFVKHMHGLI